jgi:hypothetical protein
MKKMSSAAALNESAIDSEARRMIAEERAAARRAALERQRRLDREMAELAAKERDARIALEAERIEAQRKAEEAIIAAKVRAEKEAYDAAVAAKVAELRGRSEVEVLRAELEELRDQLRGEFDTVRQATPWTAPIQDLRAQVSACPWNSGISGLQTQLAALQASVNEVKGIYKKPARQVSVWFSSGMASTAANPHNHGQAQLSNQAPTLTLQYYIVPQNTFAAQGAQHSLTIGDNTGQAIQVPECHKVFVATAKAAVPANSWSRDMTHLYKSLLESQ